MTAGPATAHERLVERLATFLGDETALPGYAAHGEMAPFPARTDPAVISVEGRTGRTAATLVLLYPDASGASCLVLTQRQPSLRKHGGQISLPGGRIEPGETPEDAARREAFEEVGVGLRGAGAPRVLGRLTPLYVPPSGFSVWPVVAALGARPAFRIQEAEVAALIEAPVAALLDPALRQRRRRALTENTAGEFEVPFFAIGAHEVWGATAMMLAEFAAVVMRVEG